MCLIQLCLCAGFFLKKFRGGHCDLNDLPSLDDVIYENLRKLRQSPVIELSNSGLLSCRAACQCKVCLSKIVHVDIELVRLCTMAWSMHEWSVVKRLQLANLKGDISSKERPILIHHNFICHAATIDLIAEMH